MKLQIGKKLRLFLVIILIGMLSATTYFTFKTIDSPGTEEKKVPLFTYNQQAKVDYSVQLLPNSLYTVSSLESGKAYITNYLDFISTSFAYIYKGERDADIKGVYNVIARVEAIDIEGKDKKNVWQRDFILQPNTNFAAKDTNININKKIPIKLVDYQLFAKKIAEESKFAPGEVQLKVLWNVNLELQTDKGPVKETLAPTMIIPLDSNYFEIGGELTKEKKGAIEETKEVQKQVDKMSLITYSILTGLFAVLLIFLVFFTKGKALPDPLQKKVNEIFKKYGERIAYIDGKISPDPNHAVYVKTIADLVRVADELSRPIMYKQVVDYGEIPAFYVLDENKVFIFELFKDFRKSTFSKNTLHESMKGNGDISI